MQKLTTQVSILTARGMSAIASVALAGPAAQEVLAKIFRANISASNPMPLFEAGQIVHGSIVDKDRVIDEVIVAAEEIDLLTIHCHGNPLLTEQIVKLCRHQGAVLVDAESFALNRYQHQSENMIAAEAKLLMQQSATLAGAKIVQSQIDAGLSQWARRLLKQIHSIDLDQVKEDIQKHTKHSDPYRSFSGFGILDEREAR